MITLTEEQITDAHTKAPQSTREWMASQQVSNLIPEIMRRHRAEEMAPSIAALVGYTLIGLFPVRELPLLLTRETSLPPEQILQIAQDIRREILAPSRATWRRSNPKRSKTTRRRYGRRGVRPRNNPYLIRAYSRGLHYHRSPNSPKLPRHHPSKYGAPPTAGCSYS